MLSTQPTFTLKVKLQRLTSIFSRALEILTATTFTLNSTSMGKAAHIAQIRNRRLHFFGGGSSLGSPRRPSTLSAAAGVVGTAAQPQTA